MTGKLWRLLERQWPALLLAIAPFSVGAVEAWRPASLPHAEVRELTSRHTGRTYRIQMSIPRGEPSAQGYPVIYVLDGNLLFPVLAQQTLMFEGNALREGREPVLIVGIGYPTDEPFDVQARAEDYTPPAADMSATGDRLSSRHGGAERFLHFIEDELKPLVEARQPVDRDRQTLFGHSYGGLFATYTLLTQVQAFQNYLISSPSLWWNRRHVFGQLAVFSAPKASVMPRVLLSVGADEQPVLEPALQNERQHHQAQRAVIDNAAELNRRLRGMGVHSELVIQPRGDHASTAFSSAALALGFALD